jgi:hypothetical protein
MQSLTRSEFLEVLNITAGAFDQLQHAGHVALAFGTPMPSTPGRYLNLDLVAMAMMLGLTPFIGRENSTVIVSSFFHQWASAVGHAEANPSADFFMAVGGVDWDANKRRPKLLLVTNGTIDQIAEDFRAAKGLTGFFTINISDIIRRLRARARAAGIDLGHAFFFAPEGVKRERNARIAKARGRRQDIVAVSRLKNASYPLETRGKA